MRWTESEIRALKALWTVGLSASCIGRLLGRNKDAVIGKVGRLKLAPRPSPLGNSQPLRVEVLGFCDVEAKPKGIESITYFPKSKRYLTTRIPKSHEVKILAEHLGLYPSGKPGSSTLRCDPVYRYV